MALIVADLPKFCIEDGDSLEIFIQLYNGYLNAVGINPNADGGPPTGKSRAMGILRSCLKGSAAEWFDENIYGKNWKLKYFITNGGANMAALRGLTIPQTGAGNTLHAHSLVPGSPADVYSNIAGNAAVTVGDAFIPNHDLFGGDVQWERIGAEPSNDPINATNAGNNNPIVLPDIRAHQALSYMRTHLPAIIDEKRKVELHKLVQGTDPIRTYWKKIERAGKLLKLPHEVVVDHFYRGLLPENADKAEEFDPDYPITKVVDILEKVEKRKVSRQQQKYVITEEVPSLVHRPQQEVREMRLNTPPSYPKEQVDQLLNAQTEKITKRFQDQIQAFQTQIQTLQNTISQQQQQKIVAQPAKKPRQYQPKPSNFDPYADDPDFVDDDPPHNTYYYQSEEQKKADLEKNLRLLGVDDATLKFAKTFARAKNRAEKIREEQEIDKLAKAMGNMNINDDPMDTTNLLRYMDEIICQDENGNDFTAYITRESKKK